MINLMTANLPATQNKRYSMDTLVPLLKAQIFNALSLGQQPDDIYIIANFDFEYMGIKTIKTKLNSACMTGSKMFALQWFLQNYKDLSNRIIFCHDLDAWQNKYFKTPIIYDVGITQYSNNKLNGGVVFWRPSAIDIVDAIVTLLLKGESKEEPTINKLFTGTFRRRVSILNRSYNVGCSGFVKRFYLADKPIKIVHFSPYNKIAWETHRLDRNGVGFVSISDKLEKLLRTFFPLATELSTEGLSRSKELAAKHKKIEKTLDLQQTSTQIKKQKSISRKIDENFYKRDLREDRQFTYKTIANTLLDYYPQTKSIIDFGCGSSWILYYFMQRQCKITGIEKNMFAEKFIHHIVRDNILYRDLRESVNIPETYNMAICLEVAEHIDEKYADQLISNITKNAPILIFSAATPGQGGSEHVNEKPFIYWKEKIFLQGFSLDKEKTNSLRKTLREKKIKLWYSKNITVFKKEI